MVDKSTPFRETGDCDLATWMTELGGSPIEGPASCHAAVRGLSALCLSQVIKESSKGTTDIARRTKNPLMLFDYTPGSDVIMLGNLPVRRFDRWVEAFIEWQHRMSDTGYKNGVYPPQCTLEQFIVTYVAGPECWSSQGTRCANGETWKPDGSKESVNVYLNQTIERINRFKEDTSMATFGNVPKPAWKDRLIPDANNRAWDNLGQRAIKGIVYHRQVGTNWGTDGWFRMMWQSNGQPGGGQMGLTDFGVDHQTGEILRWNDHEGKGYPGISPNRAGWASGPWQNPPGDGQAYVAKFGVNAINRDLVSIEVAGLYGDVIAAPGSEAIAQLSAYLADQAQIPWETYPQNPHTGLIFTYEHGEFQNNKPCCGPVLRAEIPNLVARTKEILRVAQTTAPVTYDYDVELARWIFSTAVGNDGVTYKFDPNGRVSQTWITNCRTTRRWSRLQGVSVFGSGTPSERKVFLFTDGTLIEWTRSTVRVRDTV